MGFSGGIANIVARRDWSGLAKVLREMQQEINALKTAQPYAMASRNFDGTTHPPALGTQGWALTAAGGAIINSDLLLGGRLIGNEALANPVKPDFGFSSGSNYSIPVGSGGAGGGTTRSSFSMTVPAGFTQALVSATVQDFGVNSGTGDYLNSYLDINPSGNFAYASSATVPASSSGASFAAITALLTGLSGGDSIALRSRPFTVNHSWSSDPVNSTILSATCLYLR